MNKRVYLIYNPEAECHIYDSYDYMQTVSKAVELLDRASEIKKLEILVHISTKPENGYLDKVRTLWNYRDKMLTKQFAECMELALLCEPFINDAVSCIDDMKNYGKLFKYAEVYDLKRCQTYFCAVAYYDEERNRWVDADVEFEELPESIKKAINMRNTITDYRHDL